MQSHNPHRAEVHCTKADPNRRHGHLPGGVDGDGLALANQKNELMYANYGLSCSGLLTSPTSPLTTEIPKVE